MTEQSLAPGPTTISPIWLNRLVAITVFITLAFGLVIPKLAGAGYLLLGLTGLIWLSVKGRWRPGDLVPIERLLCMAIVLYVLVWITGWLINGVDPEGYDAVGRIARLLLIIPILLLVRQLDGIEQAWWRGLTVGALLAGGYAWWSYLSGQVGPFGERVVGTTNPLYFGGISLAFAPDAAAPTARFSACRLRFACWQSQRWFWPFRPVRCPARAGPGWFCRSCWSSTFSPWVPASLHAGVTAFRRPL